MFKINNKDNAFIVNSEHVIAGWEKENTGMK